MPEYCHIGLILNENGKKMGKRDRADALRKRMKELIESGEETIETLRDKWNRALMMNRNIHEKGKSETI